MKRVLVTGASGFIGANLVRRLLADDFQVHLLLRKGFQRWRLAEVLPEVSIHQSDLQDKTQLSKIVRRIKPVHIFHLAAYGAYPHQNEFEPMVKTNIMGTFNLAMAALETGCESLVQIGSSSEYGFKDHAPKEDECLDPNSYYAITKATASMLVRYLSLKHQGNFIVLRPYAVFGPFEDLGRFIPTLIARCFKGGLPPLVAPGICRDFIYIDDFVDACFLAAKKASKFKGQIYNIGSGRQLSIKAVVDFAREYFGVRQKPKWGSMPSRIWDTNIWKSDSRKIKKDLGWKPQFSFEKGFIKTVQWFRENKDLLK